MSGVRALRLLIAGWLLAGALISAASGQTLGGGGSGVLGGDRPRPLPMNEAFPFYVSLLDDRRVSVTWQIAPAHYLYRHQFAFLLDGTNGESLRLDFSLPDGVHKNDQFFGDIEAYYDTVTATLEIDTAKRQGADLIIEYQGCAEWGFCYPPQRTSHPLTP